MTFREFKNQLGNVPLILGREAEKFGAGRQAMRNQMSRWRAKGLIVHLKRGMYLLNADDRKVNPSITFIANQLYQPSYLSMEYALSYYGLIPERVSDLTSITTKKTVRFKNTLGTFIYQRIKPDAFRGFTAVKENSRTVFFIAEPEKAVVDYLYLNLNTHGNDLKDMLENSQRFQNTNILKRARLIKWARLFNNDRLTGAVGEFCDFMKKEK